jgi:hypothetical protein
MAGVVVISFVDFFTVSSSDISAAQSRVLHPARPSPPLEGSGEVLPSEESGEVFTS